MDYTAHRIAFEQSYDTYYSPKTTGELVILNSEIIIFSVSGATDTTVNEVSS